MLATHTHYAFLSSLFSGCFSHQRAIAPRRSGHHVGHRAVQQRGACAHRTVACWGGVSWSRHWSRWRAKFGLSGPRRTPGIACIQPSTLCLSLCLERSSPNATRRAAPVGPRCCVGQVCRMWLLFVLFLLSRERGHCCPVAKHRAIALHPLPSTRALTREKNKAAPPARRRTAARAS